MEKWTWRVVDLNKPSGQECLENLRSDGIKKEVIIERFSDGSAWAFWRFQDYYIEEML